MTDPKCPTCKGIGWVCEAHPDKPWDRLQGCVCDAGAPCACNRAQGHEEPDTAAIFRREKPH